MPRSRLLPILGLAVTLGACAGSAPPQTAPTRAPAPRTAETPAPRPAAATAEPGEKPEATRQDSDATKPAADGERAGVAPGDVQRRVVEVFGDTAADPGAVTPTDVEEEVEEPDDEGGMSTDAYASNERVARYVEFFSGRGRETMEAYLEQGTRYETMIRARLRRAELPEDFVYLALIESGYNPHAYSRASAVGIWQFMGETARGMGLRVDWWVDERRDPVKSTDAAARFLRYLKEQFGSTYLAAAAYNGGPGRVARGLEKYADDLDGASGDEAFFALAEKKYLPSETKDYVPKLIAAAIVARDPERYGLKVTRQAEYAFDSVRVPASTPLAAVARAAGARTSEVVSLNPHVLRGLTPPRGALWVRVPVGAAEGFDDAFKALPDDDRKAFKKVVTKKGQSMASVARANGLSSRQLEWYNKGASKLKSGNLRPGEVILVPSAAVVAAAHDVPDPAGGRGTRGRTTVHVVKRGETLSHVAVRYGLTVPALMRMNGLRKQIIFPGQALVVRGARRSSPAAQRAAKADLRRADKPATRVAKAEREEPAGVRMFTLSTVARMPREKPAAKASSKAAAKKPAAKKPGAKKTAAKKPAAKGAKSSAKASKKPATAAGTKRKATK